MESHRDLKEQNSDIIEIQELEDQYECEVYDNNQGRKKVDATKYNSSMVPATRPVIHDEAEIEESIGDRTEMTNNQLFDKVIDSSI